MSNYPGGRIGEYLKITVKICALATLAGLLAASVAPRWRVEAQKELGLVVKEALVRGRVRTETAEIVAMLPAGMPLFGFSPARLKDELEQTPWVKRAAVHRGLDGTVRIRLEEWQPFALWQKTANSPPLLIAEDGTPIGKERLAEDFGNGLVLLKGEGAPAKAPQFLKELGKHPIEGHQIKSIALVSDRWDIKLANGITIMLDRQNPLVAWEKMAAFDRTNRLLERNLQTVDLRSPDRMILSLKKSTADKAKDRDLAKGGKK